MKTIVNVAFLFQLFFVIFVQSEEKWNSIQEMNGEFEKRFTDKDELSMKEWNEALPTESERNEMETLIDFLMALSTFENLSSTKLLSNYPLLKKSFNITFYKREYAILHEIYNPEDSLKFKRYFGYAIIASRSIASKPFLNHAAPHFKFDGNVCNQSAEIFEKTSSRTLVIAGAHRYAVRDRSPPNPCQSDFAIADPAHNNLTMFHAFNDAILSASKRHSEFDKIPYFFIQWHGMSEESCPNSPAFISCGASGNDKIYLNSSLAANKLKFAYGNGAKTPFDDPECNLAATTNVFGRHVDGIHKNEVCQKSAKNVSGYFIHIEQKKKERNDWNNWIKAVKEAFDLTNTVCKLNNKTIC
uniref:Uncharacterized protein n=1 Tax=Panagrolaimus sp. PS1159 TaxID=55785 RepID=A0AC35G7A7_9BILA